MDTSWHTYNEIAFLDQLGYHSARQDWEPYDERTGERRIRLLKTYRDTPRRYPHTVKADEVAAHVEMLLAEGGR